MKAARVVRYGEDIVLEEIPKPAIENPTDIIVKVQAAGVCRTDLHILAGAMKEATGNPDLPFTLGHENVGVIDEIGSAVKGFAVGDPVIMHPQMGCGLCLPCRVGDDMHCHNPKSPGLDGTNGGFAEFLKVSERSIVKLRKGTNPLEVAPLADAGVTVYHAVRKILPPASPGTTIAVVGLGALGQIALQLLKAMTNSKIIGIDTNDAKMKNADKYGAEHLFNAGDDGAVSEVREATGGKGANVVLDFVGEHNTPSNALSMLSRGGVYSVVGYGGQLSVPTVQLVGMELSIVGNLVGDYRDLVDLMTLYYEGKVKLQTETFPLSEVKKALMKLSNGEIMGRAVLTP